MQVHDIVGFPGDVGGKEFACHFRRRKKHRFNPWVRKIPWNRHWQPTPVFLPRKFHGQWSLAGYSPQGNKKLDMIEHPHALDIVVKLSCDLCVAEFSY